MAEGDDQDDTSLTPFFKRLRSHATQASRESARACLCALGIVLDGADLNG